MDTNQPTTPTTSGFQPDFDFSNTTTEVKSFLALNKTILIILTVVSLLIIALLSIKSFRKRMNIRCHSGFAFVCTSIAIYLGCASGKETSISLYLFSLKPTLLCYLFVLLAAVNAVIASVMLKKSSKDSKKDSNPTI